MNTYWKKFFSWSKSRQGLLQDCALAYYYTYIGRYEPDEEARVLKPLLGLKKFHFFKGNLIHECVRNQITQSQLGRLVSLEAARNFLSAEFSKIAREPNKYLTESFNGLAFEPDFLKRELDGSLAQLDNFFKVIWHSYKDLEILAHERLESFNLGNIKVWVQPDLVSRNRPGKLIISDWKTGKPEHVDADADLQLSVYILWASQHFKVAPEELGAELVFLSNSRSFPTRRSAAEIEKTKDYIRAESDKMLAASQKSQFSPRPKFNLCKGCNFSTICSASAAKKPEAKL